MAKEEEMIEKMVQPGNRNLSKELRFRLKEVKIIVDAMDVLGLHRSARLELNTFLSKYLDKP